MTTKLMDDALKEFVCFVIPKVGDVPACIVMSVGLL